MFLVGWVIGFGIGGAIGVIIMTIIAGGTRSDK